MCSSKLPLAAMCVMVVFDKESRMYQNLRTNFYGDDRHKVLAMDFFPWIEKLMEATDVTK